MPDVALLSNLTPDHIDRHGSMENYAAIKAAAAATRCAKDGQVVIGVDDAYSAAIFTAASSRRRRRRLPVSVGKVLGRGVFVVDGALYDAQDGRARQGHGSGRRAASARRAQLAECGAGLCRDQALREGPARHRRRHRQLSRAWPIAWKMSGRIGKARFINDSKATNADAAARALACLSRYFLDRRRQAQGRRHRKPGAAISRASAKPI